MTYALGKRSLERLVGVHPDLVRVVKRAIELTDHDFSVIEGLRTIETQRAYVAKSASKTMNSRHITGRILRLVISYTEIIQVNYCFRYV